MSRASSDGGLLIAARSSKGWPHGRGWPTFAEMPEGCPYRYIMLTMDRINYPGIPDPNWTYGAIFIYGAKNHIHGTFKTDAKRLLENLGKTR